jgi:hypothetical protein
MGIGTTGNFPVAYYVVLYWYLVLLILIRHSGFHFDPQLASRAGFWFTAPSAPSLPSFKYHTCMPILQGKRRRHWAQFFALVALHEKNHGQNTRGEVGGQAGLGERSTPCVLRSFWCLLDCPLVSSGARGVS